MSKVKTEKKDRTLSLIGKAGAKRAKKAGIKLPGGKRKKPAHSKKIGLGIVKYG